jgi:hypothetical protein
MMVYFNFAYESLIVHLGISTALDKISDEVISVLTPVTTLVSKPQDRHFIVTMRCSCNQCSGKAISIAYSELAQNAMNMH